MSSKVRMLWYNARVGKWFYGNSVWNRLIDESARHMVSLPLATSKKPKWQQANWMFEHTKQLGSKMFIWREPRKLEGSRSPYVRMVRELGLTGKHFTTEEMLSYRGRVAERQRLRDREERERMRLELNQARTRAAAPQVGRFAVPVANAPRLGAVRFRAAAEQAQIPPGGIGWGVAGLAALGAQDVARLQPNVIVDNAGNNGPAADAWFDNLRDFRLVPEPGEGNG
jgi:hypothetical protein